MSFSNLAFSGSGPAVDDEAAREKEDLNGHWKDQKEEMGRERVEHTERYPR